MGPLVEGMIGMLMGLKRASVLVCAAFVVLVLWLAARRAGRRGLEAAVLMLASAVVIFVTAVFTRRPPMTETAAVALVILAALLIVATAGIVLWFGLRGRRPPKVVKHSSPPWEGRGW